MSPNLKSVALAVGLLAGGCAGAEASVIGSQGFADIGTTLADGLPDGDINTATSFTIGELITNQSNDGVLTGMPMQDFGAVSFSTTSGTSLTFGNAVFGTFQSTSISAGAADPDIVYYTADGVWTPGSQGGVTDMRLASFAFSLTRTVSANAGSLSWSGTFAVTDIAVPEPSTWAMMLAGLVGLGIAGSVSRKRTAVAA
ncbi:putative secreted protein with PEP-CTERM sorting signal [Roseiarcus fermentans]|uniref:Putative secreted protein with PEP-CTERM sorting signal n=1 Tax=Roseiarcus fermentans TaxID=1473586 RepID=A0A366FQ63_9HYPH|nr:PEP-CTERM sorting domain-containing protein [Roseiarcus fermentans]RBP16844.1 putative secreted protein with PEP-CTERM sorting signal [Roseiarcus fermentans]